MKIRDFLLFFVNYEEFEITSNLNREEVVRKIEDNIGPEKEFVFSIFTTPKEEKLFSGEVSKINYTFKIKQNNQSNTKVPLLILGKIEEKEDGSRIFIRIKLEFIYKVLIFLLQLFIIIIFTAGYILKKDEQENDFSIISLLFILSMFYIIRLTSFKVRTNRIKKLLINTLNNH